jgi:hypothetical protein
VSAFDSAWAILASAYAMQVTMLDKRIDIRRAPRRGTPG